MKYCPSCKETKPRESFHKNKNRYDGLRSYCKICSVKKNRENPQWSENSLRIRHAKFYETINAAKDVPCMDCGGRFPPVCMDFDHRDPSEKKFNIGQGPSRSPQAVAAEMAKCDVVCANCHRIRTFGCAD